MGTNEGERQTLPLSGTSSFLLGQYRRFTLLIYHRDGVETIPLDRHRSVVVGRAPSATVRVEHSTLSRHHARFELRDAQVWVEDLGSTNGTKVNGEAITRRRVAPGQDITLGVATASVHEWDPGNPQLQGVLGHEQFLDLLGDELVRHRTFGQQLGLLMVQAREPVLPFQKWSHLVQAQLRPVDRVGLYSPDTLEVLMPHTGHSRLRELAGELVKTSKIQPPRLVCGTAVFPGSGGTPEALLSGLRDATSRASLRHPVGSTESAPVEVLDMVAEAPVMQDLLRSVERLARATIPVLICGETGTGKEVIARALHEKSPRARRPFRCVNCGSIPESLLESILFGHEKGAFTGADRRTSGVFIDAEGGTVLLDEVGELSAAAQAALLRVLETKRVCRVGSTEEVEVDVRLLAATHRDLEAMCPSGAFRYDLLYRINAVTLTVPALRDRVEDIPALVERFIRESEDPGARRIDPEAMQLLQRFAWPGNVRELRNVVHRSVVLAEGDSITVDDLPRHIRGGSPGIEIPGEGTLDLKTRMRQFEGTLIRQALEAAGWSRPDAARELGLPLRTLAHKIKMHGIQPPREEPLA
jgi:DNA-binding NtrC family response regulator